MQDQEKTKVFIPALIYGAMLGVAIIVIGLIFYFLDLTFKPIAGIIGPIVSIAVIVYSLHAYKNEYGKGFASYGRLVGMSVLIPFFANFLVVGFSTVRYSIDDNYFVEIKYQEMEKAKEFTDKILSWFEDSPAYEEMEKSIEEQMEKSQEKIESVKAFSQARKGASARVFGGLIVGLIAAIFLRKVPEELS